MDPTPNNTTTKTSTKASKLGWGAAFGLVLVVWVVAIALRGGGEKQIMPGWADGIPAGQQLAQEADKPMVVLFTAPGWCQPCKVLERDVLSKREVDDAVKDAFVPVQVDLTEQRPSDVEVAQMYGVQFLPTVVVMSPDGEPMETHVGPEAATWFTRLAR